MDNSIERYLEEIHFEKYFTKLKNKLKDKKIIIYGTGSLFDFINKHYDLHSLNITGISDIKYTIEQEGQIYSGYKIIPKNKIISYKPDYLLIATLKYMNIIENFICNDFKNEKIKIIPLVKAPIFKLLKEIWCN